VPAGALTDVRDAFPNRTSGLTGKDIRVGAHPCFERFVVELQQSDPPPPSAFPGYWVRYATGPVGLSPSGQTITMRGKAFLLVSLGSAMQRTDYVGYSGPRDVFPHGLSFIREYRLIEDFEGQSAWAIGLDARHPFTVTRLSGPPRLVVDVQK